ncbi:L-lactate dehydrogenase [Mycoplasma iguanae]|uniref:L-lactate dehydrogenase n=1 Tax=Mycoplasma iguanae TaxID=292461 RepID=A0ABY5R9S2_9MOLU|nr:L-lactate dehydrogenase [Mycoplasma iguanae]UVD81740.1 L-lactate dehydrogenase [Mycoplasma iguanae]
MKSKKIVLVGCGAVGTSFIYSAMNQGLANEYGLIDVFSDSMEGNAMDLEDVIASSHRDFNVYTTSYDQVGDADIIVITAGRPQKPGETRLDMVNDNVKIIRGIAQEIKKSGFNGITIIASNPVDIITYAYLQETGFEKSKVIGSGTILDTARLKREISKRLGFSTSSIDAYVIGEHGDSSVVAYSTISVAGIPFKQFEAEAGINESNYEELLETVVYKKAYEIIKRKRATYYGIGAALAALVRNIYANSKKVIVVGATLEGEYGLSGLNIGVPAIIGQNGIERVVELPLNEKEKEKLHKSAGVLKDILKQVI